MRGRSCGGVWTRRERASCLLPSCYPTSVVCWDWAEAARVCVVEQGLEAANPRRSSALYPREEETCIAHGSHRRSVNNTRAKDGRVCRLNRGWLALSSRTGLVTISNLTPRESRGERGCCFLIEPVRDVNETRGCRPGSRVRVVSTGEAVPAGGIPKEMEMGGVARGGRHRSAISCLHLSTGERGSSAAGRHAYMLSSTASHAAGPIGRDKPCSWWRVMHHGLSMGSERSDRSQGSNRGCQSPLPCSRRSSSG